MNLRQAIVLVAAVVCVALTARLGVWQLDRAAQKRAIEQATVSRQGQPLLPASRLPVTLSELSALEYRRIALEGSWVQRATVYLDNRQMRERPGFFVVTPLRLPDGTAIAVQRGWIPRNASDRQALKPFRTEGGIVRIEGLIAAPPSHLTQLGEDAPGAIRQNLDLGAYAAETGLSLRPVSLRQLDASASDADDGLLRDWPQPASKLAMHYGYAAQWFALSALTVALYVWYQIIVPRRRRRRA